MSVIKEFKCVPIRCMYHSEDYKIYACDVDKNEAKDKNITLNNYDNISILGNLHDLSIGIEYTVKALEENGRYGKQYKVTSITREKPINKGDVSNFLKEILTIRQVNSLLNAYPDIIEKVIKNDLDDIDLNKTPHIKEKTFDGIKTKIIENFSLMGLSVEFGGYLNLSILKKLFSVYPSVEKIKIEMKNDPYKCLCRINRVAFKTADNILLQLEQDINNNKDNNKNIEFKFAENLKTSKFRLMSFIEYTLNKNADEGHSFMSIKSLLTVCASGVRDCISYFKEVIKNNIFIITDSSNIALKEIYDKEVYIFTKMYNANSNIKWDIKNKDKYRDIEDFKATDKQFSIVDNVCNSQLNILCGYSGSGKSTSTKMIINMAKDNNKTFKILAPTGRASKVIAEYTGEKASTIHVGLAYNPNIGWGHNEDFPVDCDLVIIDEFSMVNISLCYNLFKAIDFTKTKVLIIGDPEQLPSIGAGNILHDMINLNICPIVMLDEIFRYGVGGLTTVATKVRKGIPFLPNTKKPITIGKDKAYTFIPSKKEDIVKNVVMLYKKLLDKFSPSEILILSPFNKGDAGSDVINESVHFLANKNCSNKNCFQYGDNKYYEGDMLLQCVNNYKAQVHNGDINLFNDDKTFISNGDVGILKEIRKSNTMINFDKEYVNYTKESFLSIKLAYSMSVHKSQGSQNKVVIFVSDKSHNIMLDSNLMYVALTRGQLRCFHIGDLNAINKAVKKKSTKRNTNSKVIIDKIKVF